jgi:hypothetical protein
MHLNELASNPTYLSMQLTWQHLLVVASSTSWVYEEAKMEAMETALGHELQHKHLSRVVGRGAPFPP